MQEPVTAGFQLSPQQRHVWLLQGEGRPLAAQLALRLEGKLDAQALRKSLQQIVNRHEILRTRFQRRPGMKFPFQVVSDNAELRWEQADLRSSGADQQKKLEEILAEQSRVDWECASPLRACLVALAAEQHILVLSLPSLCADSATLNNLARELVRSYAGSAESGAPPLQYADYSEWQNELLLKNDEETQAGKEFWRKHDCSSIPPLGLPLERKPEGGPEFQPESLALPLDQELLARAQSLAGGEDISALLLACWQALLWRLTGQAEVVLGYVSDGRNHEELGNALGLFAKSLPFHANFENDCSLAEIMERARQNRSQVGEWEDYFPWERAGENLSAGFRVEEALASQSAGGVTFSVYQQQSCANRFRLELRTAVGHGSWSLSLVYDPAFFRREVVERSARALEILIRGAVADPQSPVGALPIMEEGERRQVVATFNQTAAAYPRDKCIHHLFEEQAARTPRRPALRFAEEEFSYEELNARANQLAHFLRQRGIQANVPVGLCVERSAEMIVGLLGILKAGGCYVPLVPDNPKARLARQLAETKAPALLTQEKFLDRLPEFGGATVCLDRDRALVEKEPASNPERNNTPQDLVYVIYTSGSTGVPKGVAVRHCNLVNYSHFIGQRLQLEKHSGGLHFATVSTLSADLGNTCIFPALISGGCLHVIGYEMAMAANLFADYASRHPLDVLKITPSHLTTLLNAAEGKAILPRKYLVLGGEALSWDLVRRVTESSSCAVLNHYGPTEATVGCCTFAVRENDVRAWSPATVPIGRPIANDEVYILDSRLQPVPVGVAGELCIGGAGLAQGYLNQPRQTAERFVPHPFSKDSAARVYRTGDLARFLPDGNVEFLGRIDHQVKIRGFRVESAEIEAVLKQHPAVQHTVIVPYDDKAGDKRLAAYVVSSKQPKAEELRAFLQQALPDYMVPAAFVVLDSLPLTANGKVDLRALPSPQEGQPKPERAFVAPRNQDEQKIAAIWTEVLKLERIGVTDNFFELGGHSLLATQIISRLRNTFRVQLPLHSFLETPTVAGLAEKITQCPPVGTEEEEMARLLQELDGLSDEEAEKLLAAEMQKSGSGNPGESGAQ